MSDGVKCQCSLHSRGRVLFIGGALEWGRVKNAVLDALDGDQLSTFMNLSPVDVEHAKTYSDETYWNAIISEPIDLLINYSPVILPPEVLAKIRLPINLHTGPPKWPGRGSCSWALLEGDDTFGVTAHVMFAQPDAGSILLTHEFAIAPEDDAEALHKKAIDAMPVLAKSLIEKLRENHWQPWESPSRWARKAKTLKELQAAMVVGHVWTGWEHEAEIARYLRAFGYTGKRGPGVKIGDHVFWYTKGAP